MKRIDLLNLEFSTIDGTKRFIEETYDTDFQKAWKKVTGIARHGNDNPNHSDYRLLIESARTHGLDKLMRRPDLPFETRPGLLPEDNTYEESWQRALNWCLVRDNLNGYGFSPVHSGVMQCLVERDLIPSSVKLNYPMIVKEAIKIAVELGSQKVIKKYKEGVSKTVQVQTRSRHNFRKEMLVNWDGTCGITGLDIVDQWGGDREAAEKMIDCCHKSYCPIRDGERMNDHDDVFLCASGLHRIYDGFAQDMTIDGVRPSHNDVRDRVVTLLVMRNR